MAAEGYTHRQIAIALGRRPESIAGLILLGQRFLQEVETPHRE